VAKFVGIIDFPSQEALMADPKEVEKAALDLVVKNPGMSPESLRARLADQYSEGAVRTAVTNLWDQGRVNVGPDRKLRPTPSET
jgi:hypothetical protein